MVRVYAVKVDDEGIESWRVEGFLHRDNGPAVIYPNGVKYWYQNGLRHRIDGPAIEYTDGSKRWFLEGVEHTEEQFLEATQPKKEMTVAEIEKALGYAIKIVK